MDNESQSTICGGNCGCYGYDDHECGTLKCERCDETHYKIIHIQDGWHTISYRLVQDKVYAMDSDNELGLAMREQQMVFMDNPIMNGLYYFT
jgi:hypothetical protein